MSAALPLPAPRPRCLGLGGFPDRTLSYARLLFPARSDQDNYEVIRKVGRGKYSEVFEGVHVGKEQKCVVKVRGHTLRPRR